MKEATKVGIIPSTESIYSFMIERVRANVHVILCMSPIGDAFRNRLRQYPSLINCTTIDWFLEWPKEALLEVGNKFLMNLNLTLTITGENKVVGLASSACSSPPPPPYSSSSFSSSLSSFFPPFPADRFDSTRFDSRNRRPSLPPLLPSSFSPSYPL